MLWHKIQGTKSTGGASSFLGSRGVFVGGGQDFKLQNISNSIEYITIATTGNASSFGTLPAGVVHSGGVSNGSRGVSASGQNSSTPSWTSSINYVTIATTGNASSFGNATAARATAGISNTTRGIFSHGYGTGQTNVNVIDYITIATTGNATDFGDAGVYTNYPGCAASETRGVLAGGSSNGGVQSNIIQYLTIDTTGNTSDFGDLTSVCARASGLSDLSRGVFFYFKKIDYVTIATTGNASSFGNIYTGGAHDLTSEGVSDGTRGVIAGGWNDNSSALSSIIQYITIATTSNTTYFGDLSGVRSSAAGFSGS